jgi:phenylacetate-CoA ligase
VLTRLGEVSRKLLGNLAVLRHLPGQRRIPYLPEERWRSRRDARVRAIVRHAAATVPYYRDLFRAERIDPRDVRSAADLDLLPLLEKAAVYDAPERFRSRSVAPHRSEAFVTSGSTGRPLTIHHDHASLLANIAYGERERDVVSRLLGLRGRRREMLLLYEGSTFGKVLDFYRRTTWIPTRPVREFASIGDPIDSVVAAIDRFRPDVLLGYANYLEMLFRTVATRSLRMHLPRLVIWGGEAMSEPGRQLIRERFGIRLTSLYNAVESFKIGFECEAGREYHLHADLCHLRIVDRHGRPAAEGEPGEVVLSNLVNRATVLLNYRMGDTARRSSRRCACGRTLPLLDGLEGRVEDVLRLADGSELHPLSIWGIFKGRPEVLRYQVIQHAFDHFELRLATADEATFRRLVPAVLAALRALVGEGPRLEARFHRNLEAPGPGKFRAVVCALGEAGR